MTDHLTLMHQMARELKDLTVEETWVANARIAAPNNQHVQLILDHRQEEITQRKAKLYEDSFNISRNN